MKKETAVQVQSEIEVVEDEIRKMEYHLVGLDNEKRKTKLSLEVLKRQRKKLKSLKQNHHLRLAVNSFRLAPLILLPLKYRLPMRHTILQLRVRW